MFLLYLMWHQSIRADIFPLLVEKRPLLAGMFLLVIISRYNFIFLK